VLRYHDGDPEPYLYKARKPSGADSRRTTIGVESYDVINACPPRRV
jgi:hypothetical protein